MICFTRFFRLRVAAPPVVLAVLAVLLVACQRPPLLLEGATMGTRWHVTLPVAPGPGESDRIQDGVEEILEAVNASMSTYREEAEINRVSRAPVGQWLPLSGPLATVLEAAIAVAGHSRGAYDITVAPLVNLWGFGPGGGERVPTAAEIAEQRAVSGMDALEIDVAGSRLRMRETRQLDLSSLAKGYAVDQLALWLESEGVTDYLVEIGGEIRVAGRSPRGGAWRLAIERPHPAGGEPMATLSLSRGAVATSGNYRNFFEVDGRRYSHQIDPRTGAPVTHSLVSVTVVADSALYADAWATALSVLGLAEAMEVAEAATNTDRRVVTATHHQASKASAVTVAHRILRGNVLCMHKTVTPVVRLVTTVDTVA